MKKKIVALLTALCLVLSLAACGNSEASPQNADGTKPPASEENTSKADTIGDQTPASDSAKADDPQDAADMDEDMREITVTYLSMGPIPTGLKDVENAINEITEAEKNIHVTLEMIEPGNYPQQINLKMSSSEAFDLMVTMPAGTASFNNMASQNQFMDISDLLEEYGQGILDTIGDMIKGTTIGDAIYGVTTWRSLVTSDYICMRTDVLEDLGLLEKAQNIASLAEYEEILKAVKDSEKWNYLAGIVASDLVGTCLPLGGTYVGENSFVDDSCYDQLGDTNKIIAINPDGSDPTVINNFASDDYKKMYLKMKDWYDKGYVYGDVTTQNDKAEELVKSNVAFSFFSQSEIGVDIQKSTTCAMPMTCVKIITMPVSTSTCAKFVWGVPNTSREPEAAIEFLNMMYTDSRIANLFAWGIEGVHYQVKDGIATFVDGQSASDCPYHTIDFMYGNQFLVLPWEGRPADFRDQAMAEMNSAQVSAYLGFSCDTTGISNEISAVSNVIAEFLPSIDSGVASESDYEAFLAKLDTSGVQNIIDEYQKQLNEWLANK